MKHMRSLAALCLCGALFLTGCGQSEPAAPQGALVADGVAFTQEDYESAYTYNKGAVDMELAMYSLTPELFWQSLEDGRDVYHRRIADMTKQQLTLIAVLENQMAENKLTLNDDQLDLMMSDQESQMGGAELLDEALTQMGLSRDQFRRYLSMEVMMNQLKPVITEGHDKEIRKLFDEEFLRAKHVLISEEAGGTEKEALAKEIAEKARSGQDFDALVKEYGEDPGMEASPAGYVFKVGDMVPEFYEGTKALELNAISDPVRTNYGWHIIQRLPLGDAEFEASKTAAADYYFSSQVDQWLRGAEVTTSEEADAFSFEDLLPAEEAPAEGEAPAEEAPTEGEAPAEEAPAEDAEEK